MVGFSLLLSILDRIDCSVSCWHSLMALHSSYLLVTSAQTHRVANVLLRKIIPAQMLGLEGMPLFSTRISWLLCARIQSRGDCSQRWSLSTRRKEDPVLRRSWTVLVLLQCLACYLLECLYLSITCTIWNPCIHLSHSSCHLLPMYMDERLSGS